MLRHALIALVISSLSGVFMNDASAQGVTPTKGKDFWVGFMKNFDTDPSESIDLFIVSDQATTGTVSVPGQSWSQTFSVAANATTTVTVPNSIAENYASQIVEGKGVHIETADTVAVFAISFNPYTADGTKVLPTPTLGTNYMVAAYSGLSPWDSELVIVATEDDTEVEIIPSVNTAAGNMAGTAFTVQLNQGQSYQVFSAPGLDLTGTVVRATAASGACRPFAVFSGAGCTNLPSDCIACDHIYDENFPTDLWGTEYYITPFVFALNPGYNVAEANYTYRIMALQNGTSVSIDGGAAFIMNAGQFVEFNYETDAHCIIADQPVSVIEYMEGISCGGNGDPAMMIVDDVSKKIDNITFSTVESTVITSHYLNIVIDASDLGNVTLDGVTIDPALFQNFTACSSQLWAGFEITAGSHTLDAQGGGVSGYVYGNGDAESYAYSVGSFSPVPPIIIDEAICSNDQVVLQISGNYYTPYWYNYTAPEDTIAEGYTYTIVPPIENGIYVGVGNDFVSGCEEEFYFSVEIPEPPTLTVGPGASVNICQYESVQLSASALPNTAIYYYSWTPSAGLSNPNIANPIATPLTTTTYTVTVTTPSGCGTNTGQVTINVAGGQITNFEALPEEALFCVGDGIDLSVIAEEEVWNDDFDPGVSWGVWTLINNGAANSTCGSVSGNGLYFDGTGDRSATTNPINCVNGGNIYFTLKVANGIAPCDNAEPGDNILLEYSLDGVAFSLINTYFESAYANFTSLSIAIPVAAQSTATRFRWKQIGSFVNGQDNWVLDNVYVGVSNTSAYTYAWSPSAGLDNPTIATPLATPSISTTYFVEMTDSQSGCTYEDSIFVDVGQPFALDMIPDTSVCDVQGIQLFAIPDVGVASDYTFQWTPSAGVTGAATSTPMVSPASTTSYHVVVTSEQGCVVEDDVTVSVGQLLDLTVTASDQSICAGETIDMNAVLAGNPADITYLWTPATGVLDPADPTTQASPLVNTTYTMIVTHEPSGCQLSESVSIAVLQAFTIDAQPDEAELCITNGLQITTSNTFNGPLTWAWTPAALVSPSNLPNTTMMQNSSADLIIVATNNAGCTARDTVFVTLIVETTDLGPDTGFCEDQFLTLNTGWPSDYTFDWSSGQNTSSITINQSGLYDVTVTSPLGCVSSDQVQVDVYAYPIVDLGLDVAFCEGATYTLNAGPPGFNYNWSSGQVVPEIQVNTSDYYEVTVDNGYCFSSDGVSVIFNPLPSDPFTGETTFCFGFPPYVLELDAMNPGSTYSWPDGSTSRLYEAPNAGNVAVQIVTAFGCEATYSVLINEECQGSIWIPNAFTPDNDGINDVWLVKGENIDSYHLKIWNRWGELMYESSDIYKPWMGQRRNGDTYVENGVYVYLIEVVLRDQDGVLSDEMKFEGHVAMAR